MNFCSDNTAGVAPEILEAVGRAATGNAMPYGNDDVTRRVSVRLNEIFEREVVAWPVATGTAANALALAMLTPPFGAVLCHAEAHIMVDECGAPEFYTGGAKLIPVQGEHGKIGPDALRAALAGANPDDVHHVQPAALSLTQATESGTIYSAAEVSELAGIARERGLKVHMDGARFTNALVASNGSPADITWRAGVDVLSLGATKNGAMAAEVVVFFDPELAAKFGFRRKRAGHLVSKMRFVSAQLDAYFEGDLWLRLARNANDTAARLAAGLASLPGANLLHPVQANEIFITLPVRVAAGLRKAGFAFYDWPNSPLGTVRLVTAFDTNPATVEDFLRNAHELAGKAA